MIMDDRLYEKFASGAPTVGTHFLSSDPDTAEIAGDCGLFDYGEFCAEYSAFDMAGLYHMARAGQCGGLPLMIKLDQEAQGFWAQAALGAGFKAVLFTDIRAPEDVAACHRAVRPDTPGAGGLMGVKLRRPGFGDYEPGAYLADLERVLVAIMIEKDRAMADIDAVLAEARGRGVAMTQWGPADFGFSRGQPGLMSTPEIRPFEERLIAKSLEYGVQPRWEVADAEQAKRYADLGVRHFCVGWDRFIYRSGLARIGEGMRKLVESL